MGEYNITQINLYLELYLCFGSILLPAQHIICTSRG